MARMIPEEISRIDFNGSYGEEEVYKALKKLPDDYIVFHSIHWNKKTDSGSVQWGESDFTILHPRRGIIVIEVKSGRIRHENRKWTQTDFLTGEVYPMKDPMNQAEKSKHEFINLLEDEDDRYNRYWVEAAVWFPSIEDRILVGDLPPSYKPGNVLTKRDLATPENSIKRVYDHYNMTIKPYFRPEDAAYAVRKLSPTYESVISMASKAEVQDYYFVRMTKEQSFLLDYLDEQREAVIQGGAGTGKTILALEKVRRLADDGKVLFLCFNRHLLDYIRETQSALTPNADFYNLPALAMNRMKMADMADDETVTDYLNRYDQYLWPYKHIVIDEGQDFAEKHLVLLRSIAEMDNGCFYIFFDKNQLVQQKNGLDDWFCTFECRLLLNTNCRNTMSIAKTSNAPIGVNKIKMRIDVPGKEPNFYVAGTRESAINTLSNAIRSYTDGGIQKKQIVILTAKTENTSILSGKTSVGVYPIATARNAGGIFFTTARKFKGLESDVIIMTDIDESSFASAESRRLIYVGASRAKHYLDLICIANDTSLENISELLTGIPSKNARQELSNVLNVRIVKSAT